MQNYKYRRMVELTSNRLDSVEMCIFHGQALASLDTAQAVSVCSELLPLHGVSAELHCLHGLLMMGEGHTDVAVTAIRKALFLNSSLIMGHFLLGVLLQQTGNVKRAARSFRDTADLAGRLLDEETLPLSDNESAGEVVRACQRHLQKLSMEQV